MFLARPFHAQILFGKNDCPYGSTLYPSARPEVRGTADVDGGAYLPFLPLPRTPSRLSSFRSTDERTERVIERGRRLRTIVCAVCGDRGGVCRGPRTTTSFGPQCELTSARLVIHRQTSAQNSVRGRGKVQKRSGILAYLVIVSSPSKLLPHV